MIRTARFKGMTFDCKVFSSKKRVSIMGEDLIILVDNMEVFDAIEDSVTKEPMTKIEILDGRNLIKVIVTAAHCCGQTGKLKLEGLIETIEELKEVDLNLPKDQMDDLEKIAEIVNNSKMTFKDIAFFLAKFDMVNE